MLKKFVITIACASTFATAGASAFDGDIENGKKLFLRCKACHNITAASRPRLGPNLNDIIGRKAGSAEGYNYSRALQEAGFEWTTERLDEWLENPRGFLPGNRMAFPGLKHSKDRQDLIAYLKEATTTGR